MASFFSSSSLSSFARLSFLRLFFPAESWGVFFLPGRNCLSVIVVIVVWLVSFFSSLTDRHAVLFVDSFITPVLDKDITVVVPNSKAIKPLSTVEFEAADRVGIIHNLESRQGSKQRVLRSIQSRSVSAKTAGAGSSSSNSGSKQGDGWQRHRGFK